MKKIKLHGKGAIGEYAYALVDDDFYPLLDRFTWCAKPMKEGHSLKMYATTSFWIGSTKHQIFMHRLIMNLGPNDLIDHHNGHSVDNQMDNLKPVDHTRNGQNIYKTWHKGISYDPRYGTWWVRIKVNGKQVGGGCYDTEIDAAIAYNHLAVKYFGDTVHEKNLNRVEGWRDIIPTPHVKRRYIYKSNTSGVPGVTFYKRTAKWDANIGSKLIRLDRLGTLYLGRFSEKYEAIKARRDAELKYLGRTDIPIDLTRPDSENLLAAIAAVPKEKELADKNKLSIQIMDNNVANKIVEANHYLKRPIYIGRNISYEVKYEGLENFGVLMFGYPIFSKKEHLLGDGEPLENGELVELCRVYLPDEFPKNSATAAMAKCIKHLKDDWEALINKQVKAIISFADLEFGHEGTIYKAANFKLLGYTKGRSATPGKGHGRWANAIKEDVGQHAGVGKAVYLLPLVNSINIEVLAATYKDFKNE